MAIYDLMGLGTETCITCGCAFGLPITLQNELRKSGKAFHCPSGHSMVYKVHDVEKQLRAQIDDLKASNERLQKSLDHQRGMYRCPVAGCDYYTVQKHSLRRHLDREHQIREDVKRLPADAGKSASNSDVGA